MRHTTRHSLIRALAIALVTVFCSTAAAQEVDDLRAFAQADVAQVQLLLSGYHDLPAEGQFDQVPDAPRIVEALAHGADGPIRDRALAALGRYWPSGDVFLLYAKTLADDATRSGTRHRVMVYFADAFGERAIPAIEPYLTSEDPQLRISAVHALGRIGSDHSFAILEQFADDEENAVVLEAVDQAARVLR